MKKEIKSKFDYRDSGHRQLEVAYFHMLGSITESRRGVPRKKRVFQKTPRQYAMGVIKLTKQVGETVLLDIAESNREARKKQNRVRFHTLTVNQSHELATEELALDAAS